MVFALYNMITFSYSRVFVQIEARKRGVTVTAIAIEVGYLIVLSYNQLVSF